MGLMLSLIGPDLGLKIGPHLRPGLRPRRMVIKTNNNTNKINCDKQYEKQIIIRVATIKVTIIKTRHLIKTQDD